MKQMEQKFYILHRLMIDQNTIIFILTIITSGIVAWFLTRLQGRRLLERADLEIERLSLMTNQIRQDLEGEKAANFTLQQELNHERCLTAALEEKTSRLEKAESLSTQYQQQLTQLQSKNAELLSALDYERQQAQEKLQMLEKAQVRLSETFKSLSADALSANNQNFLHLAKSALEQFQATARQDLGQRQQSIAEMLQPMHQALLKFDVKVNDLEKQRVGAYEVLRQQVSDLVMSQKELRQETSNLVKALRAPSVRGQWGEMQLKRVVEMAGMISHCDFFEQVSTQTETGRLRPDMVIHLPGNKKVIVDAKAPLAAYLDALEATDEGVRQGKLQEHARQVRNHVRALGQRAYWEQFDFTPEFVVLFLPGETFFSAALEQDPSLIETGVKEKVILATPTTLIALLRAVSYGWRQEGIAENARHISDLGGELYKRISDLGAHVNRLGRHLGQAVDSYNQTVGTLERRVLVTARKFRELDSSVPSLDELNQLDHHPRTLQSDELAGKEEPLPKIA